MESQEMSAKGTKGSSETINLNGRLIGSYNVIWLGEPELQFAPGSGFETRANTVRKLNASIGQKLIVDVYRLDCGNGPRYACRVPGHGGFFALHSFLWFSAADPSASAIALQTRQREEEQLAQERAEAKNEYYRKRQGD